MFEFALRSVAHTTSVSHIPILVNNVNLEARGLNHIAPYTVRIVDKFSSNFEKAPKLHYVKNEDILCGQIRQWGLAKLLSGGIPKV